MLILEIIGGVIGAALLIAAVVGALIFLTGPRGT